MWYLVCKCLVRRETKQIFDVTNIKFMIKVFALTKVDIVHSIKNEILRKCTMYLYVICHCEFNNKQSAFF